MAFVSINNSLIEVGEPTRKEIFQTIKDNFDDHESRISTAENAVNAIKALDFDILGNYSLAGAPKVYFYYKLNSDILVQAVKIHQYKAFTSGTTEVNVLYKRGVNPFVGIFGVQPSVTSANGDFYTANNGTILTPNLLTDDILRVDLTSVQSGGFFNSQLTVSIEYEVL